MRLIVAEKPSVARDLARVLGLRRQEDGYLAGDDVAVTWCVGHLLELEEPGHYDDAWKRWSLDTLPMIPEKFVLRPRKDGSDQLSVVKRLLKDKRLTEVVNACDAGREGELIFRQVYEHAGCSRPVVRLWVSSLTDDAIRQGFARLRPSRDLDPLADAARSRSEADWLVGMNATRALTCRSRDAGGDALWSVGRVQTPTLAMIVARDAEIAAFVPETYWRVTARFDTPRGALDATFVRTLDAPAADEEKDKDVAPRAERLASEADAEAVVQATRGRTGRIAVANRKTRREPPPLLYDLTSLQRRANQRYGFSAQRTLELAQALYERHKLITYPRTDAQHLTSDQVPELPGVLRALATLAPYAAAAQAILAAPLRITKRVVDDAEVGDHHAILPTSRSADGMRLDADEKRVYDLVARRTLAALSPDAVIDLAEVVVHVPPAPEVALPEGVGAPLVYRAKGRVLREAGWQAIDPPAATSDVMLPVVEVEDPATATDAKAAAGQTRPPRPHDDASILRAMETAGKALDDSELRRALRHAGLGTPATRAAVLQTLIDRKYVVRDGRALRATPLGTALIEVLPVEELKSAELTGRWESRLSEMAEGREARAVFWVDVVAHTRRIVDAIRGTTELPAAASIRTREEKAALGTCPVCAAPVRQRGDVWTCDTGRTCPFVVFGTMSGKKIGVTVVKKLLRDRSTEVLTGFKSRAGKPFDAALELGDDGRVKFRYTDAGGAPHGTSAAPPARKAASTRATPTPTPTPTRSGPPPAPAEGAACPTCGEGRVIRGRAALGCSRWREGCGWRGPLPD